MGMSFNDLVRCWRSQCGLFRLELAERACLELAPHPKMKSRRTTYHVIEYLSGCMVKCNGKTTRTPGFDSVS